MHPQDNHSVTIHHYNDTKAQVCLDVVEWSEGLITTHRHIQNTSLNCKIGLCLSCGPFEEVIGARLWFILTL